MLDEGGDEVLPGLLTVADDVDARVLLFLQGQAQGSCLPSARPSSCSFQGDQSFSGSASQEGLGRLPAVEVGSSFFIGIGLSWNANGKSMDQRAAHCSSTAR